MVVLKELSQNTQFTANAIASNLTLPGKLRSLTKEVEIGKKIKQNQRANQLDEESINKVFERMTLSPSKKQQNQRRSRCKSADQLCQTKIFYKSQKHLQLVKKATQMKLTYQTGRCSIYVQSESDTDSDDQSDLNSMTNHQEKERRNAMAQRSKKVRHALKSCDAFIRLYKEQRERKKESLEAKEAYNKSFSKI